MNIPTNGNYITSRKYSYFFTQEEKLRTFLLLHTLKYKLSSYTLSTNTCGNVYFRLDVWNNLSFN